MTHQQWLSATEYLGGMPALTAIDRGSSIFLEYTIPVRKVEGIKMQVPTLCIRQMDRGGVTAHNPPNARRYGPEKIAKLQIGDHLIVQLKEQL
jgi:hypothetical protein